MSLKRRHMYCRRLSYSPTMRRTSSSPLCSASSAAYCAAVGTHITVYWWIFIICSTISAGARVADAPARHRVRLREAGEVDRPLLHPGLVEDRPMPRAGHEPVVGLAPLDKAAVVA